MDAYGARVHTTLNLSKRLIREAERFFKGKTKTEIIHEALERMVQVEKLEEHARKWAGKGKIVSYE